ncbi:MAG TPA: transporter substrate-binding domain-containing protein [Propionicimonas sp.]|nr:transporter substrate-binding domain-containing protein [Propionicimonas sp.]HRA05634.1 transporter substrate-binding domain-containing protein [Propionicimonas sp.]
MKRLIGFAAGAAALTLALTGCANYSQPAAPATTGAASTDATSSAAAPKLVSAGKLTVCTHLSYPPFQFKDEATNKITGFDVDLMDVVAKSLGVTQEVVDIDFGQITSGAVFAAGTCDAGAAAITITDERQAAAPFSDPYFAATQALLVKKGSGITDLPDLKGKTLAVQTDTTGKIYAEKNVDANGYEIKVFDDMPTGANAVLSGAADAAINDNGVMFDFAKSNPDTEVVKEFATGEHYGFNTSKDNPELLAAINKALAAAKADGTYNTIYKKWFGVDAPK